MEARREEHVNASFHRLNGEIGSLVGEIGAIENRIGSLDARLGSIPSRISRIRKMNYNVFTYMEREQASLSERWENTGPFFRKNVRGRIEGLRSELEDLERDLSWRSQERSSVDGLTSIESRLGHVKPRVLELGGHVSKNLGEFESGLQAIEQDLKIAEDTVELVSQASFPWKEGESPIFAVEAEEMKDDIEGIVTLTNLRFIFESRREVVLKKTLFIATEKKTVREVVMEKPIGMIERISKGRVGFLEGHGVFITFKPKSRLREMKLDIKGHEADRMIRLFNFITSGEAERELKALKETMGVEEREDFRTLTCDICGAPYTEEIYRGQTSVNCRYCGSVIAIP